MTALSEATRYLNALRANDQAVTPAEINNRTAPLPATRPDQTSRPAPQTERPRDWIAQGNCRGLDPDLFYPAKGSKTQAADAKTVCAGCQVRAQCLTWALDHNEEHGIWGGLSERERRRLRSKLPRWSRCRRCQSRYIKRHPSQQYCGTTCPALTNTAAAAPAWADKRRNRTGAA